MINKKILDVRRRLDKLDNKLLYLIKKRSNLVDIVLKNIIQIQENMSFL